MNNLEKLCRPILACICNYEQYAAASPLTMERFKAEVEFLLENARREAAKKPSLAAEFAKIERPLVFFVDYMVKEGSFSFSKGWRELARQYNELSGDEKFFDLLDKAFNDPEAENVIPLYYTMMGLGFDGVHKGDYGFIEKELRLCAARFSEPPDLFTEELTPQNPALEAKTHRKSHFAMAVNFILALSLLFLISSGVYNFITFGNITDDYRTALAAAAENSTLGGAPEAADA
ncbi:MAG: DotU family type IV/VI secretion system protein, partial [Deferribacteraceae bacterium]|nr:DotU family type IV/VI secretion system protein [Deferribacteraceae bacterium]